MSGRKVRARGRMSLDPPGRNRWEQMYARELDALRSGGAIAAWSYEAVSLKLADGARYTPDFLVVLPDGLIELHEVKGHWREAAKVRIKVARDLYPWFRFLVVRREREKFVMEEV